LSLEFQYNLISREVQMKFYFSQKLLQNTNQGARWDLQLFISNIFCYDIHQYCTNC